MSLTLQFINIILIVISMIFATVFYLVKFMKTRTKKSIRSRLTNLDKQINKLQFKKRNLENVILETSLPSKSYLENEINEIEKELYKLTSEQDYLLSKLGD